MLDLVQRVSELEKENEQLREENRSLYRKVMEVWHSMSNGTYDPDTLEVKVKFPRDVMPKEQIAKAVMNELLFQMGE